MFSFRLDRKQLDKMFPLCGNFVDIVYINSKVIVASEDGICYSQLMFDAYAKDPNQKRLGFRIETSILKRLALNGKVEVYLSDNEVHLSMYGEGSDVIYKSSTPMMNSFIEFSEMANLVNRFDDYDYSALTVEPPLIKLASKFNDVFVSEGRFSYIYHHNSYIFCKSPLKPFCVDGKAFKNVTAIINRFKLIDDYLVFLEGNLFIRLTRNRMPLLSDLEYLANSKAITRYELNIKRCNYLINSLGAEDYSTELNLTTNKMIINSNKGKFECKVDILNEKKKEKTLEEKLKELNNPSLNANSLNKLRHRIVKIPKWVFGVIGDYSNIILYVKKNTCLVTFGTTHLVFQGGFCSEG